ncbi:MAG: hypothetical protein JXA67_00025 [Micromonosporaceae bacterium]|nr:hypothetical protein [Micromonosporaceae bacterium]
MNALDWRHHRIGPPRACRICHQPALMRDQHGQPCHKVCAETTPLRDPHTGTGAQGDVLTALTAAPSAYRRAA